MSRGLANMGRGAARTFRTDDNEAKMKSKRKTISRRAGIRQEATKS
jgi:hypothetical protein